MDGFVPYLSTLPPGTQNGAEQDLLCVPRGCMGQSCWTGREPLIFIGAKNPAPVPQAHSQLRRSHSLFPDLAWRPKSPITK